MWTNELAIEKKLTYSFDDEVAGKSCYDIDKKRIEINFIGYFDSSSNQYIDRPCVWIIENWAYAKSKLSSETAYNDLDRHLGIISMILSAEINKDNLELTANTIDGRYIDLIFNNAQLRLL
jgi:hypothetical protein